MTLRLLSRPIATIAVAMAILAGCASSGRAPVEVRTPARAPAAGTTAGTPAEVAPPVARPGYYIVKRGDTLYSIAHQFERDYREVANWNGIEDPRIIKVGQEIRVVPPEGAANRPIAPAPVIETRPLDASTSAPGAAAPTPATAAVTPAKTTARTEPRGGRIPYSAQALKDLQNPEKTAGASTPVAVLPAAGASAAVAGKAETKADGKSDIKPIAAQSAAADTKPTDAKPAETKAAAGEDDLDWAWPSSGKILTSFNDSSNKGLDLGGSIGDPVLAAGAGKVVYVGAGLRGYGNLVIIKHNNSFLSAYAHNSEILVKEGQTVQKGQKIAALGNSDADRAKLHFEIRRQGKPVDPVKYLPSR